MKNTVTYTDPEGDTVLAKFVPPYDRLRDQTARRIAKIWADEQTRLAKVKADTIAQIDKLRAAAAKQAGVPELGGARGNLQFRSYDGTITVTLDRQYRTEFDERLKFAQQLIFEAVEDINARVQAAIEASGADGRDMRDATQNAKNLMEIARKAFQPRKSGNLDMQRIRDLRNYNVSHPKWKQACEIISDCERTVGHRDYIRVTVRQAADAKPEPITLDIASL